MLLWEEKVELRSLLANTVVLMCKTGLVPKIQGEFCVEGLIGISLGKQDLMLVSINETLQGGRTGSMFDDQYTETLEGDSTGSLCDNQHTHTPMTRKNHKRSHSPEDYSPMFSDDDASEISDQDQDTAPPTRKLRRRSYIDDTCSTMHHSDTEAEKHATPGTNHSPECGGNNKTSQDIRYAGSKLQACGNSGTDACNQVGNTNRPADEGNKRSFVVDVKQEHTTAGNNCSVVLVDIAKSPRCTTTGRVQREETEACTVQSHPSSLDHNAESGMTHHLVLEVENSHCTGSSLTQSTGAEGHRVQSHLSSPHRTAKHIMTHPLVMEVDIIENSHCAGTSLQLEGTESHPDSHHHIAQSTTDTAAIQAQNQQIIEISDDSFEETDPEAVHSDSNSDVDTADCTMTVQSLMEVDSGKDPYNTASCLLHSEKTEWYTAQPESPAVQSETSSQDHSAESTIPNSTAASDTAWPTKVGSNSAPHHTGESTITDTVDRNTALPGELKIKSGGKIISVSVEQARLRKRAISSITCKDKLSLARSIVLGLSHIAMIKAAPESRNYFIKKYKVMIRGDQNRKTSSQKKEAEALMKAIGLSTDEECKIQDIPKFENHLNVDIVVFGSGNCDYTLLYPANKDLLSRKERIYLLHTEPDNIRHFDFITKLTGFFSKACVCHYCLVGFDKKDLHSCTKYCSVCRVYGCQEISPFVCDDCNAKCRSKGCFIRHKQRFGIRSSICSRVLYCKKCSVCIRKFIRYKGQTDIDHCCSDPVVIQVHNEMVEVKIANDSFEGTDADNLHPHPYSPHYTAESTITDPTFGSNTAWPANTFVINSPGPMKVEIKSPHQKDKCAVTDTTVDSNRAVSTTLENILPPHRITEFTITCATAESNNVVPAKVGSKSPPDHTAESTVTEGGNSIVPPTDGSKSPANHRTESAMTDAIAASDTAVSAKVAVPARVENILPVKVPAKVGSKSPSHHTAESTVTDGSNNTVPPTDGSKSPADHTAESTTTDGSDNLGHLTVGSKSPADHTPESTTTDGSNSTGHPTDGSKSPADHTTESTTTDGSDDLGHLTVGSKSPPQHTDESVMTDAIPASDTAWPALVGSIPTSHHTAESALTGDTAGGNTSLLVRYKSKSGGRNSTLPVEQARLRKKAIASIRSNDKLNLARSIVLGMSHLEMVKASPENRDYFQKKYKVMIRGEQNRKTSTQKKEAEALMKVIGLSYNEECTIQDISKFENYLNVDIVVFGPGNCEYTLLNPVEKESLSRKDRIYLLHTEHSDGRHFDVVTNCKALFSTDYFCPNCLVGFDRKGSHVCKRYCNVCMYDDCEEMNPVVCKDCNAKCRSEACLTGHKICSAKETISACERFWYCTKCTAWVDRKRKDIEDHCCIKCVRHGRFTVFGGQ